MRTAQRLANEIMEVVLVDENFGDCSDALLGCIVVLLCTISSSPDEANKNAESLVAFLKSECAQAWPRYADHRRAYAEEKKRASAQ